MLTEAPNLQPIIILGVHLNSTLKRLEKDANFSLGSSLWNICEFYSEVVQLTPLKTSKLNFNSATCWSLVRWRLRDGRFFTAEILWMLSISTVPATFTKAQILNLNVSTTFKRNQVRKPDYHILKGKQFIGSEHSHCCLLLFELSLDLGGWIH